MTNTTLIPAVGDCGSVSALLRGKHTVAWASCPCLDGFRLQMAGGTGAVRSDLFKGRHGGRPSISEIYFGSRSYLRPTLLRFFFIGLASLSLACASARAEIYDPPTSSPGGVRGNVTSPISAAVLVGANLTSIYNGTVSPDKKSFEFKGIPVGKYDILLFDEPADKNRKGAIYSGLAVTPGKSEVPAQFADRFIERTRLNDKFFSRFNIAGFSFTDGNAIGLAVIERIKESPITHMDGTVQKHYLRRVELATMELAVDDWKTNTNRHVYRVEMPMETGKPFLDYVPVPALGRIRVVDSVKDLGQISLPAGGDAKE